MDRTTAATLARSLMNEHGLGHWAFEFDRAKTRLGICRYSRKTIGLSVHFVDLNDEARIRNTILHEIAHALVGPGHGHDYKWRMTARSIGCDGKRCTDPSTVERPAAAWHGTCPSCGYVATRHRLSDKARSLACSRCCRRYARGRYDARFVFVWSRNQRVA